MGANTRRGSCGLTENQKRLRLSYPGKSFYEK